MRRDRVFATLSILLLALLTSGCTAYGFQETPIETAAVACDFSQNDKAWLKRAIKAWHDTSNHITKIAPIGRMQAVFFDANCVWVSDDAMRSGKEERAIWSKDDHNGSLTLPNGHLIPAGVNSFTQSGKDGAFLVMSLPSVWRDGGVDGGPLGLESLMVAVLLHEGSHVVQYPTYGKQIDELVERYTLGDDFNDDSIQDRFEKDREFAGLIQKEIDLLFAAATARSLTETRALAREARDLMGKRRDKFFVGKNEPLRESEDLWLTLEGSGQWAGYSWLISPLGAKLPTDVAMPGFGTRSKWWTQNEGLAMFLVLERLGFDWKKHAFRDGELTVTQMLDAALKSSMSGNP